jgi:hypothetical protein
LPKFRNGTYVNKTKAKRRKVSKYLRISAGPLRGEYVHRIVAAAKIGRELTPKETIDHEDGNSLNDHWANLSEPISWEEHGRRTAERLRKTKRGRKEGTILSPMTTTAYIELSKDSESIDFERIAKLLGERHSIRLLHASMRRC